MSEKFVTFYRLLIDDGITDNAPVILNPHWGHSGVFTQFSAILCSPVVGASTQFHSSAPISGTKLGTALLAK